VSRRQAAIVMQADVTDGSAVPASAAAQRAAGSGERRGERSMTGKAVAVSAGAAAGAVSEGVPGISWASRERGTEGAGGLREDARRQGKDGKNERGERASSEERGVETFTPLFVVFSFR